jgi:hypothetical protein
VRGTPVKNIFPPSEAAPLFEPWDFPTRPRRHRRPRKLTLAQALREAAKAGVNVTGATIENGKVSLMFGKGAPAASENELEAWMASHAD